MLVETPRASGGPAPFAVFVDPDVEAYRDQTIDRTFSLRRHLSKTLGVAAGILALGVWLAWGESAMAWVTLPLYWFIANLFEWGIHRFLMHQPRFPRVLYVNHAKIHHRAYDGPSQEIRHVQDLSLVMMPWYTLLFVFFLASPVALAAGMVGGRAQAGIFLIASVTYFFCYELLHTLHHLPKTVLRRWGLDDSALLTSLRRQHHHHHQLREMTRSNFNVTLPVADKLLGTWVAPADETSFDSHTD